MRRVCGLFRLINCPLFLYDFMSHIHLCLSFQRLVELFKTAHVLLKFVFIYDHVSNRFNMTISMCPSVWHRLPIRPPFQLPQWRDHWDLIGKSRDKEPVLEWTWQCWKCPCTCWLVEKSHSIIYSWNIQVDIIQNTKKAGTGHQKMGERSYQWQPMAVFIYICNTADDPASKLLRFNLVGLFHEKTKCVLYWKMESTNTENKSCSWCQSCMNSIPEPFNYPGRSNNARQNQLSDRFCSRYHIYKQVYHISVWFPNIWDQAILLQRYDKGQDWLPFPN